MLQWLRKLIIRAPRAQPVDLSGRHIIVTGASPNSIGFETARILASWGAHVAITTRSNPERVAAQLRELTGAGKRISAQAMDLTDAQSVTRFADWYRAQSGGRLDVLINNAGIHLDLMSDWKEPKRVDGHEIHWRTNYLGTMQLTHALLPLLVQTGQQTNDARVVNVVSMLYTRGRNADLFTPTRKYNSWNAYGNSKLALVHATFELQRRYAPQVQGYCLHPGAVYTNIADKGLAGHGLIGKIRQVLAPAEKFFLLTPEEGAQTSVYCATQVGLIGGQYFRAFGAEAPNSEAADAQVAGHYWVQAVAWIGAKGMRNLDATIDIHH